MRIVAGDIVTNYTLDGPSDAPVVTLSHSLAASLEMWEPQLPALTQRFRVLRYDTRGHGGSEVPPGAYTLSVLADDVRNLLGALGIARTHFVGLSMGGMIGQTLALEHPEIKKQIESEIFTGSMADISFLLIIYFMVTSVFSARIVFVTVSPPAV